VSESQLVTSEETAELSDAYSDILARLNVSPEELQQRMDFYEEREALLMRHASELEEQVAERTRALEASIQVSRRLSTILDPTQLVIEVVEQVQQAFDYYHVHIYLFDAAEQNLMMAGGTGEAGRAMLASGHRIPRGKGLVGRAAETQKVVLTPDVSQEPGWLPNPLLPDTQAEIAVPIQVGEKVLGVLDVQHNITAGLTQEDAELLEAIGNQVGVALQNARTFTAAQGQAERETLINVINQKVQRATTLDGMLQIVARELGQALGAQRAKVQLAPNPQPVDGRE
jgi:GAF domain-containing protein